MKAAIAAGHDLTTGAAAQMLKQGGNAFDGALAAMLMSCVCEPVLASPGGGGYLMARDGVTGKIVFYDFFVQTPLKKKPESALEFYGAHADFGNVTQLFHIGAGAAAFPALLPGFFAIQNDLCHFKISALTQPARDAARNGITINAFQAYLHSVIKPIIAAHKDVSALFLPSGGLPVSGDVHKNIGLASLFEDMAQEGRAICHRGEYAKAIVRQSALHGGHLIQADLTGYRVKKHQPLKINFQGYEIYLPPPPAAGGTLIAFGLLLIEKLVAEGDLKMPNLVQLVQVMEATHQARGSVGQSMLEAGSIAKGLKGMQNCKVVSKGTTHISVIDQFMNIAALTLTNGEGNGRLVGDYGFMLNNMLGEEDLHPKGFHNWQEGQRLSSMMAPTIIKSPDGRWTALGSGGSNRIRTAILQVIINQVMRKMPLQQAIDLARIHAEKCGTVSFEFSAALEHFTKQELNALAAAYSEIHNWQERNVFFGGVHAVSGDENWNFTAAADKRRSGCALVIDEE